MMSSFTHSIGLLPTVLRQWSPWTLFGAALLAAAALKNLKSLPFMWHMRIGHALFVHRHPPKDGPRPGILFLPVLSHTSTPAADCDYNMHKSNSTYFADLDVARLHLLGALGLASVLKQAPRPALGGVVCTFRRPIAPYQRVSIYSKVLTWDGKWLYLASWIVPRASRKASGRPFVPDPSTVFGVSVARYVFKQGRRTIPPAVVLRDAGLLPADAPVSEFEGFPSDSSVGVKGTDADLAQEWTWEMVKEQRQRGQAASALMGDVEAMKGDLRLDGLLGEFA